MTSKHEGSLTEKYTESVEKKGFQIPPLLYSYRIRYI